MEKCQIDKKELENFRTYFTGFVNQTGLVTAINSIEKPKAYFSPGQATLCETIVDVIATYETFRNTLRKNVFRQSSASVEHFLDIYSLYAALLEGSEILGKKFKDNKETDLDFHLNETFNAKKLNADYATPFDYERSIKSPEPNGIGYFVSEYKRIISAVLAENAMSTDKIIHITRDYFTKLAEKLKEDMHDGACSSLLDRLSDVYIQINDITLNGLNYLDGHPENSDAPKVRFSDVIGNEEIKVRLMDFGIKLLQYDPISRKNPNEGLSSTYLLVGEPGGGKTMLAQALYNFLLDNSADPRDRKKKKNVQFLMLDAKIFSKWRGETEERIGQLFDQMEDPEKITVMLIDDVDTVVANRDNSGDNEADVKTTGYIMNRLEGFRSQCRGNAVIISTSNKDYNLDAALRPRLGRIIDVVKGVETDEQYSSLVKSLLSKELHEDYDSIVKVDDFSSISSLLRDYKLSGRDARNIIEGVLSKATCLVNSKDKQDGLTDVVDELTEENKAKIFLSYEETKKINRQYYRSIDSGTITDAIERYVEDMKRQEQLSRQKRMEGMVNEMDLRQGALNMRIARLKESKSQEEEEVKDAN